MTDLPVVYVCHVSQCVVITLDYCAAHVLQTTSILSFTHLIMWSNIIWELISTLGMFLLLFLSNRIVLISMSPRYLAKEVGELNEYDFMILWFWGKKINVWISFFVACVVRLLYSIKMRRKTQPCENKM